MEGLSGLLKDYDYLKQKCRALEIESDRWRERCMDKESDVHRKNIWLLDALMKVKKSLRPHEHYEFNDVVMKSAILASLNPREIEYLCTQEYRRL